MPIKPTHKRVEYVSAREVEKPEQIITSSGIVALAPGMFVLETEGQPVRYMDAEEFASSGFVETDESDEDTEQSSDVESDKDSAPVKKSPSRRPAAAKG